VSITRLQQARQMYSTGQRVAKTLDGSRPGYRGDAAYGRSSRSSQATSIGQARGATGKGGGASLGGGRDKNEQPAQQFIGGKSYNVTPETRGDRDRAQLKQQILNQTKVGGNRIDKFGNTKKSPFRQGGGLGSLLMGALGMFMGIPGLGLLTGGLGNLKGKLGDAFGNFNRKMRGVNPDGTTRTQAQYEQARYNRQQQKRLDKLFAAKDRGFNQIGFGDFTKKTMDFTPGQQAKIDELMAAGFMPSTARNVDSGRGSGLRGTLNLNNLEQGDLNNIESLVAASQVPQRIDNSMYGADQDRYRIPSFIDEYDSNLGIETNLNLQAGPDGITYYNNDTQPQQGIMSYPSDLANEFQDMAIQAGNYSQNAVGNQLYGKEYDVLNPFEQQQIDKAIETYGTKSTGQLASGTSFLDT